MLWHARGTLSSLQHLAQMNSRVWRIAAFALWAASVVAGPLRFEDLNLVERSGGTVNCGSCAFVTTFEIVQPPYDPTDTLSIIGLMTVLGIIGLVGVRVRVRAKR